MATRTTRTLSGISYSVTRTAAGNKYESECYAPTAFGAFGPRFTIRAHSGSKAGFKYNIEDAQQNRYNAFKTLAECGEWAALMINDFPTQNQVTTRCPGGWTVYAHIIGCCPCHNAPEAPAAPATEPAPAPARPGFPGYVSAFGAPSPVADTVPPEAVPTAPVSVPDSRETLKCPVSDDFAPDSLESQSDSPLLALIVDGLALALSALTESHRADILAMVDRADRLGDARYPRADRGLAMAVTGLPLARRGALEAALARLVQGDSERRALEDAALDEANRALEV